MAEAEEIALRWFQAIQDHDVEGAAQMLDPDVDFVSPGGSFKGSDGARPFLQANVDGFPDARFDLSNVFASGDRAFQVRDRITEHHAYWDQMTFLGQLGLVPEGPPSA